MKAIRNSLLRGLLVTVILASGAGAEVPLVAIMHTGENFMKALDGIKAELGRQYSFTVIDVDKAKSIADVAEKCRAAKPQGMVLMDSKALGIARELEKSDAAIAGLPKFVLMTLQVEASTKGLKNVSGVKFEVPAYTLITHFRKLSEKDFTRVGVFYRKSFSSMIDEAKRLLAKEKIIVSGICLDCEKNVVLSPEKAASIMMKKAGELVSKEQVEVFWMPADNLIINRESILKVWIPKIKKQKRPIVVPLENLASLEMNLGIFAANPDFLELGTQVAAQIIEVIENETPIEEIGFEPLISVKSVLNLKVAKEIGWSINNERVGRVDKVFGKK